MNTEREDSTTLILTPLVTFSGVRGVPLLALSHNSLCPQLVIGPDAVTVRVIRRHRFSYDSLACIRAERGLRHRIALVPKRGWRTFTVGFSSQQQARGAVAALASYGAPLEPELLSMLDHAISSTT